MSSSYRRRPLTPLSVLRKRRDDLFALIQQAEAEDANGIAPRWMEEEMDEVVNALVTRADEEG